MYSCDLVFEYLSCQIEEFDIVARFLQLCELVGLLCSVVIYSNISCFSCSMTLCVVVFFLETVILKAASIPILGLIILLHLCL
jgi:hypothetical protein